MCWCDEYNCWLNIPALIKVVKCWMFEIQNNGKEKSGNDRLSFEGRIFTNIEFTNSCEWPDVHGNAILSEFEKLIGIIGK